MQALGQLVVTYVAGHPNSGILLPQLWRLSAPVVLAAMISLYNTDATTISRTLEICQASIFKRTFLSWREHCQEESAALAVKWCLAIL